MQIIDKNTPTLEIFARNAVPYGYSIGLEPLKFQMKSIYFK